MKFDFDQVIERRGTHSVKWDCSRRFTGEKELLPFWVADMDFPVPDEVTQAIKERAAHGIYGYTIAPDSYFDAVIQWMRRRHHWEVKPEWFVMTPGVVPAVNIAIQEFSDPGDEIVLQMPVYYPFIHGIEKNGRTILKNPLKLDGHRYEMDLDHLESAIGPRTRMVVLCSPHNPVARVWGRHELRRLVEICLAHDLILVSDEIHSDLMMEGHTHVPTATVHADAARCLITCTAASKTFNLAGLNTSNILIENETLRNRFKQSLDNLGLHHPNLFGMVAVEAAYRHGEAWLDALLHYVAANDRFMREFLAAHLPAVRAYPLEGTYLAWLDFRGLNLSDARIKELMLKKARIWLDDGDMFGPEGAGFQRINIACPRATLERGLKAMVKVFGTQS